jgi:hypothetical protein
MTPATAKEKVEENEVGAINSEHPTEGFIKPTVICTNQGVGQEKVVSYITGEMTEEEHRTFVAHVGECQYCLREIVLWRTAQVLAEEEDEPLGAAPAT